MTPLVYQLTIESPARVSLAIPEKRLLFEAPICHDERARLTIARLDRFITRYSDNCEKDDLRLLGELLFSVLFDGPATEITQTRYSGQRFEVPLGKPLGAVFREQLASRGADTRPQRLNLVFRPGSGELARYPWEFLYVATDHDEGFVVAKRASGLSVSRIIPPELQRVAPPGPLKLWVVWSAPRSLGALLNVEATAIMIAQKLGRRIGVKAENLADATFESLATKLRDAGALAPDILHFIGHGRFAEGNSQIAFRRSAEDMRLARLDAKSPDSVVGDADWKNVDDLAARLQGSPPWLVFLHTCDSARSDTNVEAFRGAAQLVADAQVPFVIAMQHQIASEDARSFAETFYDRLGQGDTIVEAVKAGRNWLGTLTPTWGHRRFATPVVYLRSDNQVLVPPTAPASVNGQDVEQRCPYANCVRMVDFTSKLCMCKRNKVKFCSNNHANMWDATECQRRGCDEVFAPLPVSASAPPAVTPSADLGTA